MPDATTWIAHTATRAVIRLLLFVVFVCLLSCWFVLALGNWIVYGLCKGPHLLSFVAFFTDGFACILGRPIFARLLFLTF